MSKEIEIMILGSLLHRKDFSKKVMPFLKEKLFEHDSTVAISKVVLQYFEKYGEIPSREASEIELENLKGVPEKAFQEAKESVATLYSPQLAEKISKQNLDWLLDRTEKYFKDRSCFLAIMESMSIIDGENKKLTREAIPDILKDALNISFDSEVGHDYLEDAEERFNFYHQTEERIPFALNALNKACGGQGFPRKTLLIPIAPTGVGKSMFMTDWAAFLLTAGYNVLYVTLELAEERVGERIDAKLFNTELKNLTDMPKSTFDNHIAKIKQKSHGKLIIREYSPGTFHANHLRFLLQELKTKKNMEPDVIMIDYLNLMASYRMKDNSNSYSYIKAITEEIRGVGMQHNAVVCAPTQTNRSGVGVTDYGLTEVSDSYGAAMTADAIFGFISTPEMEAMNQMRVKFMKNRFGNPDFSFLVGVNRPKMSLYDVEVKSETPTLSKQKSTTKLEASKQKGGLVFDDE